jgi:hypothetical protein
MNINSFDYVDNAKYKNRIYKIQPLSDEGFKHYTNKNSYTHKYLKSLSPSRINEIFNDDSCVQDRTNYEILNNEKSELLLNYELQ